MHHNLLTKYNIQITHKLHSSYVKRHSKNAWKITKQIIYLLSLTNTSLPCSDFKIHFFLLISKLALLITKHQLCRVWCHQQYNIFSIENRHKRLVWTKPWEWLYGQTLFTNITIERHSISAVKNDLRVYANKVKFVQ